MPRRKREVPWLDTRDGVYHAFWYNAEKRRTERFSLRTRDPVEATHSFSVFLQDGDHVYRPRPLGLTCGDALDDYLREHVELKCVDKQRQRDGIANLKLYFKDMAIAAVGIPECREYTSSRCGGQLSMLTKKGKARPASPGTVKRELNILAAAINHSVAWKRLPRNEVPTLEKPKTAASKGLWLFPDELEKLRAAADQRTRDFIDIAYWTGARRHSVETLTWFQVDLTRGRINFAKPDDIVTKKRKPIVPIAPELMPILTRLRSTATTSSAVLGSTKPCWKAFLRAAKKAGLRDLSARDMRAPGRASPHVLRHSIATHRLNQGWSIKRVADLLGDTPITVARVYGHACVGIENLAEEKV